MVFGTIQGSAVVCNHRSGEVLRSYDSGVSESAGAGAEDAILGLCWLRRAPDKFIAGSSSGVLTCCSAAAAEAAAPAAAVPEATEATPPNAGGKGGQGGPSSAVLTTADARGASGATRGKDGRLPPGVLARYPSFEKLTSVHVNSQDSLLATCGYQNGVRLYDLETSKVLMVRRLFGSAVNSACLRLFGAGA